MDGHDKELRQSVRILLNLIVCTPQMCIVPLSSTWKNAQLGDAMIHQLEQDSRKMAEQQEKVKGMLFS